MKSLSDLTTPATVTRRLLEKDVQKQCVDWARARGYWARKFSSQSQRSVPDYLFASAIHNAPGYRTKFAVEFKAPGKNETESQRDEIDAMRRAGWVVFVCDSFEVFKQQVEVVEKEVAEFGYC
ncbi:MAG TPA: hypothetical protein VGU20_30960 [Stellaceae bacterium]|nr:hypothetical protein [Terriglobia bacterium]HEV2551771.1 hypothetical protein [Stellaceae bacterium]